MIVNSQRTETSRRYSAAVADGVSSWSKTGVDAGAYSSVLVTAARELMSDDTQVGMEGGVCQKVIEKAQEFAKVLQHSDQYLIAARSAQNCAILLKSITVVDVEGCASLLRVYPNVLHILQL